MRAVRAHRVLTVVSLFAATLLALAGSACTPDAAPTPTAGPAPVAAPVKGTAKPEGTVTVGFHDFSKEILDPSLDGAIGLIMYGEIFDPWIGSSPAGKLDTAYGVVESYKPNADATVWTFTLKKGIKWHDGVEMTSDDMKWTLEYYARQESICTMCGTVKGNLNQVEIVDRYTARLHFKKPDVNIPAEFAPLEGDVRMLPKHYFEKAGAAGFAQKPVGSGPWKFASRGLGQFIEYEANTDYWNPRRIPGFAKLRILLVPEARTRVAMLKRGEVDLISVNSQDVEQLKKDGFKILGPKAVGYSMVVFFKSYDPAFLTNKLEFRKALALAVDWDAIFKAFYPKEVASRHEGGGPLFSPVTQGYDPALGPYQYQPDEAKRLLQQAGYKGEKVTFWNYALSYNPEQREVNEVIASYWRAAGINVELVPVEFGIIRSKAVARPQAFDPPAAIGVNVPAARPSLLGNMRVWMMSREVGGTFSAYWNLEKLDRYFAELSAIVDEKERDQRLRKINQELYGEYWSIPIGIVNLAYAAGPKIADWQPTNGALDEYAFETLTPKR